MFFNVTGRGVWWKLRLEVVLLQNWESSRSIGNFHQYAVMEVLECDSLCQTEFDFMSIKRWFGQKVTYIFCWKQKLLLYKLHLIQFNRFTVQSIFGQLFDLNIRPSLLICLVICSDWELWKCFSAGNIISKVFMTCEMFNLKYCFKIVVKFLVAMVPNGLTEMDGHMKCLKLVVKGNNLVWAQK